MSRANPTPVPADAHLALPADVVADGIEWVEVESEMAQETFSGLVAGLAAWDGTKLRRSNGKNEQS